MRRTSGLSPASASTTGTCRPHGLQPLCSTRQSQNFYGRAINKREIFTLSFRRRGSAKLGQPFAARLSVARYGCCAAGTVRMVPYLLKLRWKVGSVLAWLCPAVAMA